MAEHRADSQYVRQRHQRSDRQVYATPQHHDGLGHGGEGQRQRTKGERAPFEGTVVGLDGDADRQQQEQQDVDRDSPALAAQDPPDEQAGRAGQSADIGGHQLSWRMSISAGRPCAARSKACSSACEAGISWTNRPPNRTITRLQASWISGSSDVNKSTADPLAESSRTSPQIFRFLPI